MSNNELSKTTLTKQPDNCAEVCQLIKDLPDGILIYYGEQILYVNAVAMMLAGEKECSTLLQKPLSTYFRSNSTHRLPRTHQDLVKHEHQSYTTELRMLHPDGAILSVEAIIGATTFHGQPAMLAVIRDISQRKQLEDKIRQQANYDLLTGLPNRALFLDRLTHELIRAEREHKCVVLMFVDLDKFKWVNDTMGHAAGDELLQEVANRLIASHRRSDTVARLAGDEFTVILPDIVKGPYSERVARELLAQLAKPFTLAGQEVFISASVGITVFPDDATTVVDLLKNADNAMYHAKSDGRNAYRFFTSDMHAKALERMELEKDLRHALTRNELKLHYQPIINLANKKLMGVESFLRWNHPTRGSIAPNLFMTLAEETGLIVPITDWVLRKACAQASLWRQRTNCNDFFISVNLSCSRHRNLFDGDRIQQILNDSDLPPCALALEITENVLIEEQDKAMAILNHMTELGITLWLDDFGTGYSSLRILKLLPVNGIKIDRTFVGDVTENAESAVLVEIILSMARSLKLQVIGEGVETEDQHIFLQQHGCQMAQGFYFGQPMPTTDLDQWLSDNGHCKKINPT